MYQLPKCQIHTFRKRWSFIRWCFFPVNILKIVDAQVVFKTKSKVTKTNKIILSL